MRVLRQEIPEFNQLFDQSIIYNIVKKDNHLLLLPKEKHTSTLIWMHGLGGSTEKQLSLFNNPNYTPVNLETKVILLSPPLRTVTKENNEIITSWYDIKVEDVLSVWLKEPPNTIWGCEEAEESRLLVSTFLDEEIKILGDSSKIIIGGFSQGATMALLVGLTSNQTLGGIMGFSGFMFPFTKSNEKSSLTPILLSHGQKDDRVPIQLAEGTFQLLKNTHKSQIIFEVEENVDHALTLKSIGFMKDFIKSRL